MDRLTPRRRRLSPWVVVAVAFIVNFPVVNHVLTQRSIDRSGVDVQASLIDTARTGEGSEASYGVAFRFDETIDPAQSIWTSEVDRATFQRALDTETVEVRVLADRPSAFEIEGASTSRLGWYLTGIVDVLLIAGVLLLWRRGKRAATGLVLVDALEDVQQHVPGSGPQTGFEELGAATYLVTGEVTHIDPDAVVLDTGVRQVRVALGAHSNRVGFQQPGQVTARLSDLPFERPPA